MSCWDCKIERCKKLQKYIKENEEYNIYDLYLRGYNDVDDFKKDFENNLKEVRSIMNACKELEG